ncbi:MAG TPA: hypothetical protein VHA10_06580 [Hypericibacter adhaerens]|jgi:hypothetical protein|uniref:Uncharacterized protein n=1 Tax=Hypericibacter adhaerens TaxID=2602016 RepID=A0A5J6MZS8_9PROT|nr:hypothetical protein [Hypericibacter adhaerens]QEX22677.1 hypothetical protein FRZ61_26090 [Hypericibacter adhaerens]HWA42858.1 hypothetical protein [Hypericibacter adhaerens]
MNRLGTILRELLALFVDDGSLALAILAWIAVVAFVLPALDLAPGWRAVVLFLGCIVILFENAIRSARRAGR